MLNAAPTISQVGFGDSAAGMLCVVLNLPKRSLSTVSV
jgi:hypothetical protein